MVPQLLAALLVLERPAAAEERIQAADALYEGRQDLKKLDQAIALWEGVLADEPTSYAAAWRLTRAWYFYGTHAEGRRRRVELFEKGSAAGRTAVGLAPHRPEGHFWLGVALGGLGQEKGILKSLSLAGPIREEMEAVLKIDPDYERGGAHRVLGRYYYKLPSFLGGDKEKSLKHLQESLRRNPENTLTNLFLGDTLAAMGRNAEARRSYQAVLDAPVHPSWVAEDADNKAAARKAIDRLRP